MCTLEIDGPFRRKQIKRTVTKREIRYTTIMIHKYSDWYVLILESFGSIQFCIYEILCISILIVTTF
jgi:hypothetical protein